MRRRLDHTVSYRSRQNIPAPVPESIAVGNNTCRRPCRLLNKYQSLKVLMPRNTYTHYIVKQAIQTVCIYTWLSSTASLHSIINPSRAHDTRRQGEPEDLSEEHEDNAKQAVCTPRDHHALKGLEEVECRVGTVGHVQVGRDSASGAGGGRVLTPAAGCRCGLRRLERRQGRLVECQWSVGRQSVPRPGPARGRQSWKTVVDWRPR